QLPHGRLHLEAAPTGPETAHWRIDRLPNGPTVVAGRAGDPLQQRQRGVLAELGLITGATAGPGVRPDEYATVLAQLAMTGAALHVTDLPGAVAALLDDELAALLSTPVPGADPLEWELRSVAQRRAALRGHATGFGLGRVAAAAYPSLRRPPAVSALLVTRRPHLVRQAVAALAAQSYPELEVIVGLHGVELPDGVRAELAGCGIDVQVFTVPADLSFGEALGEATRRACGSLVTKVDDDDRYGPEHVWDLVLARHYSGAAVVGKGAEFVHLQRRDLTVRRAMAAETYTDVVAGGTMLLGRGDLEAVGGWRPVDRSVDRALLDRVLHAGGLVYRTHGFGFVYTRHGGGHTWDPGDEYFLRDAARRFPGLPPYAEFGLDRVTA
ncbi:MAG TPA: glycosyltransferase family 2 protein, partial [Actinoplanes sp.]|nr:glycosyltransferase family 2 protein [Actinoplanes sp.]